METPTHKPSPWFWIVAVLALLWNLGGLMAFVMQVTMTPGQTAGLPQNEQDLYNSTPDWITVVFGIATIGSVAGSILLLMKRKLATPLLITSFIAILVQMFWVLFISKSLEVRGNSAAGLPVSIVLVGGLLVWFSRKAEAKGWLK